MLTTDDAGTLWAYCEHCRTLWLDVPGGERVVHPCGPRVGQRLPGGIIVEHDRELRSVPVQAATRVILATGQSVGQNGGQIDRLRALLAEALPLVGYAPPPGGTLAARSLRDRIEAAIKETT